jgi:cbb3-type cytochrome oxidase subunit 3
MKLLNGIISVFLGIGSLYMMFIKAQTDQDFILGFGLLLMAIIFLCFMLLEERKEEVERLRYTIMKLKDIN